LGLLQPIADGIKLVIKEGIIPVMSDKLQFFLAPLVTFFLSLSVWSLVPFSDYSLFVDSDYSVLYILAISSLSVYGIIFAGWSSNSRYAFLGALRSAAQMISYELSIGLILISLILCVGSLSLLDIVLFQERIWFVVPFFPLFVIYLVSALAETNRPPFDLPEAEGELVAGYNVEYSAVGFALFFIAEYANIIFQSILVVLLFFGGWLPSSGGSYGFLFLSLKIIFVLFVFLWVRAAFPRYRYDQLMRLGWKVFLPLTLGWVVFVSGFLLAFGFLPIFFE
jgi:NADH-quinone oxidoreductase subunit H